MRFRPSAIAVLLFVLASASAFGQVPEQLDYALELVPGGVAVGGGDIVYGVVVTADWWTQAKEPFVVHLSVPPGLTPQRNCTGEMQFDEATRVFTWSDRLDNESIALNSCPLVFRIDPSVLPGTSYTLEGTLTTQLPDRNPANNSAAHTGVVLAHSDLVLESSIDDLRYRPGARVTYTFRITNHGPQDAQDVLFTDDLSPHVEVVAFTQSQGPAAGFSGPNAYVPLLRAGESVTLHLVAQVKSDFEAANIGNRAKVRATSADLVLQNNDVDLWTFAGPDADLAVRSERVATGSATRIPVTIRVTNAGADAVQNVTLSSALAADIGKVKIVAITPSQGMCSAPVESSIFTEIPLPPEWEFECAMGTLAPGAEATVSLLIERTTDSGGFRLTTGVGPSQNDPHMENNLVHLFANTFHVRRRVVGR